ncbi:unnamed protein product [Darwinula stevensoni]|uniref:Glucosamine-6-phosphate deaminase n=1 Tax=Darwinula stevensoni TaxID=69355 RepID=A0A7R9A201_9CRUS|nr:unnamed protein product [Darwinula stevensoni]CAG0884664.1 unnamed protein product [Darwinula stevensoni]
MRLVILDDADQVADWSARYVISQINKLNPGPEKFFVLGLPTGGTPLGMYKKLIEYHRQGKVSFQYVKTFNMDEYVGIPRDHPESYHSYMFHNFFKHIDIDPKNIHILDGNAADLEQECNEYEKKIKEAGGVELFVGGIGPDGHIAFNEPGSSLVSRTRVKTLARETILANARFFDNDLLKVPTQALTVGVGTVMDAREVMILITGAHKAHALHKAIEEGVNHMWTVSAFQQHPRTFFICDEDATLELKVKTVKYFKSICLLFLFEMDVPFVAGKLIGVFSACQDNTDSTRLTMTRHAKNATASQVYTYHEKKKDAQASGYGSQSMRFGKESIKDFDCCCLTLQPCRKPVVTPEGYLYDKESILEYILKKKREIARQLKEYEKQKANNEVDSRQKGMEVSQEVVREISTKEGIIAQKKGEPGMSQSVSNMAVGKSSQLPSFWIPQLTPSAKAGKMKKPDKTISCPMSGQPLKTKDFIDVVFTPVKDPDDKKSLIAKQNRYMCPVTHDILTNATPSAVLRPTGHVVTMECVEKLIKKDMLHPLTGQKLTENDIIPLQRGGTGFAGTNEKLEAKQARPVLQA